MKNRAEWAEKSAVMILIIAFAIFVIGTAAIPAVLAVKYTWAWLLLYPVLLIAFLIYAAAVSRK